MDISMAFKLIADLCLSRGIRAANRVVVCDVDGDWSVTINGTREDHDGIPPFHGAVNYRGMPYGVLAPNGGVLIPGSEDALIAAVGAALAQESA